jgi:hypothetical protein
VVTHPTLAAAPIYNFGLDEAALAILHPVEPLAARYEAGLADLLAGCSPNVLHNPLGRRLLVHGFLSPLHSLMVTMSQKSSFLQPANSVSQVLIPDILVQHVVETQFSKGAARLLDFCSDTPPSGAISTLTVTRRPVPVANFESTRV